MNITSTVTTMTAIEETEKARFRIEYTIQDKSLSRVQFTIHKLQKDENEEDNYLGSIYVENDFYSCNIPVGADPAHYFGAAVRFMETIQGSIPKEDTDGNTDGNTGGNTGEDSGE